MKPKNNQTYTIVDFFKQILEIDINDETQTTQLLYDFIKCFLTNDLDTIIIDLEMLQRVLLSYKSSILFLSLYRTQINKYFDDLGYIISYLKILNQSYKQILFQQSIKQTVKTTTEKKKPKQIDKYILERIKFDMAMNNLINIIIEDDETKNKDNVTVNEPELTETPGGISIDPSSTDQLNTQQNIQNTPDVYNTNTDFNFNLNQEDSDMSDIKPVDINEDELNKMLKNSVFYDLYLAQLNFDFKHISRLFNIIINMAKMFTNVNNVNIKKISL